MRSGSPPHLGFISRTKHCGRSRYLIRNKRHKADIVRMRGVRKGGAAPCRCGKVGYSAKRGGVLLTPFKRELHSEGCNPDPDSELGRESNGKTAKDPRHLVYEARRIQILSSFCFRDMNKRNFVADILGLLRQHTHQGLLHLIHSKFCDYGSLPTSLCTCS